jgi:integrase
MIAHIYKRHRNRDGRHEMSRSYYARIRLDGEYVVETVCLQTSDKMVAEKKLTDIVREKERERAGILAPKLQRESAQKPLAAHLDDFVADLHALGRSPSHIAHVATRVRRQLKECGWLHTSDISADRYTAWRASQHSLGPKTINEYLNSLCAMLNWMERQGRIEGNPLTRVVKVDVRGHQQKRRAFTDEELERLVYLTAAFTGLRIGELRQLIWADVKLDGEHPQLLVRAATTKNRNEAVVPLHPKLVEDFKRLASANPAPESAVFAECANSDRFIRIDMEKAGIERIDASGRKLDFHALRYTFATMLARHNVSQRLAQELMRHSDPRLTANIYTDVTKLPTFEAVNELPWLDRVGEKQIPESPKQGTPNGTQTPDFLVQNSAQAVPTTERGISPAKPVAARVWRPLSNPVSKNKLAGAGVSTTNSNHFVYHADEPEERQARRGLGTNLGV